MRLIALILLFVLFPVPVSAKYDPLTVQNNKFGIHIVDPNDIAETAELVNTTGGDWGYVTLVMQEDDRNRDKWQNIFNIMRSRHLIPIVRLATHIDGDSWAQPYQGSDRDWAKFLDSLNWPTENRYVIIYNEPNHANEWGKVIDPEGYARVFVSYARTLKETSEDFFVIPAGLDVSAASDGRSLDASVYLRRMVGAEPSMLDLMDGWSSHSYPNPAFSGSPYATGRGSLRSFEWELAQLASLGLTRTIGVFITETGWVHSEGVRTNPANHPSSRVAEYMRIAAITAWQDPRIVAVTPFVYSYQGLPFDHFSWRQLGSNTFYPQYFAYQQIPKQQGIPRQREKYTVDKPVIPASLVAGSTYKVTALLKNEGQGIFSERSGYAVEFVTEPRFIVVRDPIPDMEPGQYGALTLHIETPNLPGAYPYRIDIVHNGTRTTVESGTLTLVPPPSVDITVQLGWRRDNTAINATVLVYDYHTLLHKIPGVAFRNGQATIQDLRNVVPGNKYRIVVLVPYYLPRQEVVTLRKDTTRVRVSRMYPLDFNQDGAFSSADIFTLFTMQPNFITSLFVNP